MLEPTSGLHQAMVHSAWGNMVPSLLWGTYDVTDPWPISDSWPWQVQASH